MYEHIKICIFVTFCFQNVISYNIYQLDSAEGSKLLPKIRQLLLNQGNDVLEYLNPSVSHVKKEQTRFQPIGKSVLVKRKIPHGYKTAEYEYDPKLNTIFKPLTRYHVKIPIEKHEKSILNDMEFEQRQKEKLNNDLIVLVQKEDSQPDFLSQIQKYNNIKQNSRQQKRKNKGRFQTLLNKFYDKGTLLLLRDKSGEDNSMYLPGKHPADLQPGKDSSSYESMEKTVYPIYSFYNYWTYPKNIVQDRCPGNLVKVGNMCVNSIGHRKSAHPSFSRRSNHHKRRHSKRNARKRHHGKKKS